MVEKKLIGKIAHFFPKISVAVVDLIDTIKVGDKISIESESGSIEQVVDSMQIEHKNITESNKGQSIGLKIAGQTKEGAQVFKLIE
ncbi:MAG: translation elongation factor-like protein [Candidatus Bathyarchaeota archaeon]